MKKIYIFDGCDNTRGEAIRFYQEASRLGEVTLFIKSDQIITRETGAPPGFTLAERIYFAESIRFISRVIPPVNDEDSFFPPVVSEEDVLFVKEHDDTPELKSHAHSLGLEYRICTEKELSGYPCYPELDDFGRMTGTDERKILVTGCYDLFHTGHVRFFEEVSSYGQLYVVIGSDRNVRLLKGDDRPLYNEMERLFIIDAVKFVRKVLISTGSGWMDAEPEIKVLKPDIYAVNEDGDKPEKRDFCEKHDLQYLILKRTPREGLPARSSTDLRGF